VLSKISASRDVAEIVAIGHRGTCRRYVGSFSEQIVVEKERLSSFDFMICLGEIMYARLVKSLVSCMDNHTAPFDLLYNHVFACYMQKSRNHCFPGRYMSNIIGVCTDASRTP